MEERGGERERERDKEDISWVDSTPPPPTHTHTHTHTHRGKPSLLSTLIHVMHCDGQHWLQAPSTDTDLQVAHDAEGLRSAQAACGGAGQLVGPADQEVPCGRVAAALGAHVAELGEAQLILALLVLLGRDQDPRGYTAG